VLLFNEVFRKTQITEKMLYPSSIATTHLFPYRAHVYSPDGS